MGYLKIVFLAALPLLLYLLLRPSARRQLRRFFGAMLWAASAISALTGSFLFADARGDYWVLVGGFLLWLFAAYAALVARAVDRAGKRLPAAE